MVKMISAHQKKSSDGLGAVRFLVRGLVVLSFLLLVVTFNYFTSGTIPSLYGVDSNVHFDNRVLLDDEGGASNCTSKNLANKVDKCAFVKSQCEPEGLIDYLKFYYCTARNPSGWLLLVFLLLLYFYLLGGTAERFFCPALCRLSDGLGMSPNVAGVTLLALGNGSPDIFSTIASVQQDLFGQALGSLLGAGMFVVSVVVGSVTLASKKVIPKVTRRPFLRDAGFYLTILIILFFICWDGRIRLWQSIMFIFFYAAYVATVVIGRMIYQKRKKARLLKLAISIPATEMDEDEFEFIGSGTSGKSYDEYEEEEYERYTQSLHKEASANASDTGGIGASLLHAASTFENVTDDNLEPFFHLKKPQKQSFRSRMAKNMAALGVYISKVGFWRNKTKSELKREARMTIAKNRYHDPPRRTVLKHTIQRISDLDDIDSESESSVSEEEFATQPPSSTRVRNAGWGVGNIINHHLLSVNNAPELDNDIDPTVEQAEGPIFGAEYRGLDEGVKLFSDESLFQEPDITWEDEIDTTTWSGAIKANWRNLKEILEWDEADTLRSKIFMFADMPRLFLQHFTIHFAEPNTYFRPFYVFQPIGIAILLLSALGGWSLHTKLPGPLGAWIMPVAIALSVLIYFTTKNEEPPIYEWGFIVVGLFMSVVWIYFTAQELVALLSAAGKILGISNAIMGLTVLAWGNSIGDMVSNVVVAKKGFPQMAISACYAAPLSNMLLGLGISSTLKIVKMKVTSFSLDGQLTNTVFWGFIFLITTLIATVIVVPLSKFSFVRMTGFGLLAMYGLFTLISLLTEFDKIFPTMLIWDKWPGRH